MMRLYSLSKENLELSAQEAVHLGRLRQHRLIDSLLLSDADFDFTKLAYTKRVLRFLFFAPTLKLLMEKLKQFDFNKVYDGSFSFRIIDEAKDHAKRKALSEKGIAGLIYRKLDKPTVDLINPKTRFTLIVTDTAYFFGILLWENTEDFDSRKAHRRPAPHPTSLHPRLARALVNMLDPREVLDPFCGSGGILIEAGLLGKRAIGYDIDPVMLKRAKLNLDHYGITAYELRLGDALKVKGKYEAIITDLPYGKNSKLSDVHQTYKGFLKHATLLTRRMIVIFPDFIDHERLVSGTGWKVRQAFTHYLHRTLSKHILLLER